MAFLLGFFSHFILDAIPHIDPGTFHKIKSGENKSWPAWVYLSIFAEFIILVIIFYLLFGQRADFNLLCIGALGGITVDILENNPLRWMRQWPILKQLQWCHEKIHHDLPSEKWYFGALTSIIVIGGSLWYLLKF